MIHLAYANRLEELGTLLAQRLARRADPLEPGLVVLGGGLLEWWVRLSLAAHNGIAAHLVVQSLPAFVAERAKSSGLGILVDRARLEAALLSLFSTSGALADPSYARLRSFLDAAGPTSTARDRRRAQMAAELASLFFTYGLERPRQTLTWLDGTAPTGELPEHARWQAPLLRDLFRPEGPFGAQARDALSELPFLTWPRLLASPEAVRLVPSTPVHLFVPHLLSEAEEEIITLLAGRGELHVYALNPCREFWEDAPKRRGRPRVTRQPDLRQLDLPLLPEPLPSLTEDEPRALSLWGSEARRRIRFFNRLAEGDFQDAFVDPMPGAAGTRLQALQSALLRRSRSAGTSSSSDDESLLVLGAPSMARACEAVAAEIWQRVFEAPASEPLAFRDVAVFVAGPEPDAWLSALAVAFHEARALPLSIIDRPLRAASPFVEAVDLLLSLPCGRLSRRELVQTFSHPNLRARLGITSSDELTALAVHLGVVREADDASAPGDPVTWDEGLRRLALGRARDDDASDGTAGASMPELGISVGIGAAWRARADAWGLTLRALLSDLEALRQASLPLAVWSDVFRRLIDAYVLPQDKGDEPARLRVYDALAGLEAAAAAAPARVGYQAARELFRNALDRLRTADGPALVHGVTVAPWGSARSVPYRLIIVVGLDEGRFPASSRAHHLDVRNDDERGRALKPRDRDAGVFLDTLLAARDGLILVYQDRDLTTGERLRPSAIIDELSEVAVAAGLATAPGLPTRELPLWRHHDAATRAAFPAAEAEHEAARVAEALAQAPPTRLASAVPGSSLPVASTSPRAPLAAPETGTRRLRLTQLRDFLRCPLQGSAKAALGLEAPGDETEEALRQDELLDPARLARSALLQQAFWRALWDAAGSRRGELPGRDRLLAGYDAVLARLIQTGRYPAGLFASARRDLDLQVLTAWEAALARVEPACTGPRPAFRLGRGIPEMRVDSAPPLRLSLSASAVGRVELHGSFPPSVALGEDEAWLAPSPRPLKRSHFPPLKDTRIAEALLFHMVRTAALDAARPHTLVLLSSEPDEGPTVARFKAIAPGDARAYLEVLLTELYAGPHAYLLPYEAVLKWRPLIARGRKGAEDARPVDDVAPGPALAAEMQLLFGDSYYRGKLSSQYGPIRQWMDAPLVTASEAGHIWETRFAPLWALLEDVS